MKPSFQGFVRYIKENINLHPEKIEIIHNFLFTPKDRVLNFGDLISTRKFSDSEIKTIFNELIKYKIADVEFQCPECDYFETLNGQVGSCNNCGYYQEETIWNNIYISVSGELREDDKTILSKTRHNERKALALATQWSSSRGIPYLIIDLVSSQDVQKDLGSAGYNEYLECFRDFFLYEILSQVKNYFILGEIGDAVKVAFHKEDDLLKTLTLLGQKLPHETTLNQFRNSSNIQYFPRYSACASILNLPTNPRNGKISNPKDLIVTTLNGAIDINSVELTELFRLDSGLSFNNDIYEQAQIAVFMFKPLIDAFEWKDVVTKEKVTVKDGKISGQGVYAIVLFDEDGMTTSNEPENYIKQK